MIVERCDCGTSEMQLVTAFNYFAVECKECLKHGPSSTSKEGAVREWNKKCRTAKREPTKEVRHVH